MLIFEGEVNNISELLEESGGTRIHFTREKEMPQQNPVSEVTRTIYRLNRLLSEYMQHHMEAEGLRDLQPSIQVVLLPLLEEEGQTLSTLARKLNMKAPTVTVIANRLEERGWIRRERGTDDRRQVRLYLTEPGRATADTLAKIRRKMVQQMGAGVDRDSVTSVNEILMRMYNSIENKLP
jgi:DNA-binding MarR family transcriptional regulator